MDPAPELSIVLPVHDEEPVLPELHRRLLSVLDGLELSYELLYVDDGSQDGSLDLLRRLAHDDRRVGVLVLSRCFGHQAALTAGLDHARGRAVVLMDSDLQDPPEVIPALVARWREGYDVVRSRRRARPGESGFKRATAWAYYRMLRTLAGVEIPADSGDFSLMTAPAAAAVRGLRERSRFLRGLVAWIGFRQTFVPYDRGPRPAGRSKYDVGGMTALALTGLFSMSRRPLALVGVAGALACLGALGALARGVPAATAGLFFLGGVQLLSIWILGQYAMRAAEDARARPLYVVREGLNRPR